MARIGDEIPADSFETLLVGHVAKYRQGASARQWRQQGGDRLLQRRQAELAAARLARERPRRRLVQLRAPAQLEQRPPPRPSLSDERFELRVHRREAAVLLQDAGGVGNALEQLGREGIRAGLRGLAPEEARD